MLRSGFLLGMSGVAAILSVMVLPAVRHGADAWAAPMPQRSAIEAPTAAKPLPGLRPVSLAISPVRPTADRVARSDTGAASVPAVSGSPVSQEIPVKSRRMTREGCETPISSLAGPEARRMVPGRCMT